MVLTMLVGCPSMSRDAGVVVGDTSVASGPGMTGFRWDIWKDGANLQWRGRSSSYMISFMWCRILNGPMYPGLSFL